MWVHIPAFPLTSCRVLWNVLKGWALQFLRPWIWGVEGPTAPPYGTVVRSQSVGIVMCWEWGPAHSEHPTILGRSTGAAVHLPQVPPLSGGGASLRPRCHQYCRWGQPLSCGEFFSSIPNRSPKFRTETRGNWHKQFQTIISEDKWLHLDMKTPLRGFPRLFMYSMAQSHEWIRQTARTRPGRRRACGEQHLLRDLLSLKAAAGGGPWGKGLWFTPPSLHWLMDRGHTVEQVIN